MADTSITRGKGRGHWAPVLVGEDIGKPRWSATVCCPQCGRHLSLINHQIDARGDVFPSIGHPPEYMPCGWHPNAQLVGWDLLPPPPQPLPLSTCERCGRRQHSVGAWGVGWGFKLVCKDCIATITAEGKSESQS